MKLNVEHGLLWFGWGKYHCTVCVRVCEMERREVACIDMVYCVGELADSERCPQDGRAEF